VGEAVARGAVVGTLELAGSHCFPAACLHWGWLEGDTYQVHDLLWDERYLWHGSRNFVKLDPQSRPAHVLRLRRWVSREQNFDQFM
jgi:hypothetical protein